MFYKFKGILIMKIKVNSKKAIKKATEETVYFLVFPVLVLINIILKIFMKVKGYININIIFVAFSRIGHMAGDTESFLRSNLRNTDK